jgi:hypothetical protein
VKNKKKDIICEIDYPYCSKHVLVMRETTVIQPAEKAVKEEKYFAEKSAQTKLQE